MEHNMNQTVRIQPRQVGAADVAHDVAHDAVHDAVHDAPRGAVGRAAARGAPSAPCSPALPGEHGGRKPQPPRAAATAHDAVHDAVHDAAGVIARLEEAGRALLSLPESGYSTRLRTSSLDIVRTTLENYGWADTRARPPVPDAATITRMDAALGWIARIPPDRVVLRRIVGARALVSPLTDRHLFPWRRLAAVLGADHKAVQRWHAQAIALLVASLNAAPA
jgi:hypothetical protein